MKKTVFSMIFAAVAGLGFCFGPDDIHTYTLENGLHVFVLSDTTSALVRLELTVDAGFSRQSQKDAGFFPLYARMAGADETGADAVRFVRMASPSSLEKAAEELSAKLKTVSCDDKSLRAALNEMKAEVTEYEASAAGFINTTVDSRVFSAEPWKHESGVYPALFKSTTLSECRTILETIGKRYYTAENANLFISGNISDTEALNLCAEFFSDVNRNGGRGGTGGAGTGTGGRTGTGGAGLASGDSAGTGGQGAGNGRRSGTGGGSATGVEGAASRKFVLTDSELSADLTQIIVKYTDFTRDEADVLALILNDDGLAFKTRLSDDASLAILGNEYINVASVQEKSSSHLVVQSLLERTKKSPCAQAERFLNLLDFDGTFDINEIRWAAGIFDSAIARRRDDSASLMELFASYLASSPLDAEAAKAELFSRSGRFGEMDAKLLSVKEQMQSPYVFVLVNSRVYQKYAKEFSKAGYTAVTRKNGSWYTQTFYKNLMKAKAETAAKKASEDSARRFIDENMKQFSSFTLTNGIPVAVKTIPGAENTAIVLELSGGELLFAKKNPGIADVLTNALASNIRTQLDYFSSQGYVKGNCDVSAETFASCSRITLKCETVDVPACIASAGQALVYADIAPALADGIAYDLRTQWRLSTGTATFQLLCEAVRNLYGKEVSALYNDKQDKPSTLDYTQIAASYPLLLDSSRFSITVAGGIQDEQVLREMLNRSFAVLESRKATEDLKKTVGEPAFNGKSRRTAIRHLFLTDISADKAGPRPAVLVPTKNFYDPVLYCIACPSADSTDAALFNALLYELKTRLEEKTGSSQKVLIDCADQNLPFARLYITNVVRTSETDALFKKTVRELKADIENLVSVSEEIAFTEKNPWLSAVENRWLIETLADAGTVDGTARLMQKSRQESGDATLYLRQYDAVHRATAADYFLISQFYLQETGGYTVYSADSKR